MPHQCTNCGHAFPDGSKEMLSGCPDCGGNKFQFKPPGNNDSQSTPESSPPDTSSSDPSPPDPSTSQSSQSPPETPQSTPETPQSPPETEGVADESGFVSKEIENPPESPAQSSARSDVVSSSELTAAGSAAPTESTVEPTPGQPVDQSTKDAETAEGTKDTADTEHTDDPEHTDDIDHTEPEDIEHTDDIDHTEPEDSNLNELRKELNDQFESIRIVSPGQYELNLMELYDREEYIISLREDGRYVIEVPDGWGDS